MRDKLLLFYHQSPMDSKSEAQSMKIDKNTKQDLFSLLPDELIHHILSFLDMTVVVKTSVLSKRWRYLWTSIPILNFNFDYYDKKIHPTSTGLVGFIRFVNMVLFLRRGGANIKTFRILDKLPHNSCVTTEEIWCSTGRHIDTWTHVAVLNNVEELDLQVYCRQNLKLPCCLFTCKSLTTLKLDMGSRSFVEFPTTIGLPSLKHVHLRLITFGCEEMSNFVSRCPALERLTIKDCYSSGKTNNLTISSLQLKELELKLAGSLGIFSMYPGYSNVTVSAPRLLTFTCRDHSKMHYYNLVDISSLVRVEMELGNVADKGERKWTSENVERIIKCLQGVSTVRSLTLSLSAMLLESFFDVPAGSGGVVITSFCNLSVLKLKTVWSKFSVHCIMYLLERCPNLETFIWNTANCPRIDQVNFDWKKHSASWIAGLQLECMHHLKLIEFKGLVGHANELDFLKFLLKKATILEKMTISTSEARSYSLACQKRVKKFRAYLSSFPFASSSVQVEFLA